MASPDSPQRAPNLLFVLIDDLGWADLGCYGSSFYETPRLDQLAQQSMRFTQAYAACPVCSPTRASLLTGRYPARLGLTDYIDSSGRHHPLRGRLVDAPYVDHLPLDQISLARALGQAGYHTWHLGKWHLGGAEFSPRRHGFDVNLGGGEWGHPPRGYFSPWGLPNLPDGPAGAYLTDALTDQAIRLVHDHAARDDGRPFFMNLWHYAVHTPIQAPEPLVEKYRRKARALRLDRIDPFVEGELFPTDNKRNQHVMRRVVQSDPAYAAMVENLDTNLGRLLDALADTGQADDTLVVFTSDNGGLATSEGSPTCNAPLSEGKGWLAEGGTREPWLVRWPGRVRPGSVCATPITSPDLYPTLLAAAGLPPLPEQHLDGLNLLPLWTEQADLPPRALFWHYPHYGNQGGTPGSVVRQGPWKLIERFEDARCELYQVADDVSEATDLAGDAPEQVAALRDELHRWRQAVEARLPGRGTEG